MSEKDLVANINMFQVHNIDLSGIKNKELSIRVESKKVEFKRLMALNWH